MAFECHWNKNTTLAFLQSIRDEPIIWDELHPENKNRLARHKAIERVGNLMGIPIQEVNKKWSSLRGQYVREKRKKPPGTSKWFAFDEMEMLYLNKVDPDPLSGYDQDYQDDEMLSDSSGSSPTPTSIPIPTLVPRDSSVEVPIVTQKQNIHVKTEPRPKIQIAPSPTIQISTPPVQIAPCTAPQITIPQILPQTLPFYKIIDNQPTPPKEDDIAIFGSYVAAQLRHFRPKLQSKAKLEICKLLYNIEMENFKNDSKVDYCASPDMSTSDHNY